MGPFADRGAAIREIRELKAVFDIKEAHTDTKWHMDFQKRRIGLLTETKRRQAFPKGQGSACRFAVIFSNTYRLIDYAPFSLRLPLAAARQHMKRAPVFHNPTDYEKQICSIRSDYFFLEYKI